MKKITKRIMALMLSLVMILGCIPSFTNVVSANDISTIADVLATAEGSFPRNNQGILPDNAWISSEGNKIYINLDYLYAYIDSAGNQNALAAINNSVAKNADGDYTAFDGNFVFKMTDNKLTSIIYNNATSSAKGTYEPVKTISKVADVLATVEGVFPNEPSTGWISDDGYTAFCSGDTLWIQNTSESDTIDITTVLTLNADGNYVNTYKQITFVMTNGKLTSIVSTKTDYAGTYIPTITEVNLTSTGLLATNVQTLTYEVPDDADYTIDVVLSTGWCSEYECNNPYDFTATGDAYKKIVLAPESGYKFNSNVSVSLNGTGVVCDNVEIKSDGTLRVVIKATVQPITISLDFDKPTTHSELTNLEYNFKNEKDKFTSVGEVLDSFKSYRWHDEVANKDNNYLGYFLLESKYVFATPVSDINPIPHYKDECESIKKLIYRNQEINIKTINTYMDIKTNTDILNMKTNDIICIRVIYDTPESKNYEIYIFEKIYLGKSASLTIPTAEGTTLESLINNATLTDTTGTASFKESGSPAKKSITAYEIINGAYSNQTKLTESNVLEKDKEYIVLIDISDTEADAYFTVYLNNTPLQFTSNLLQSRFNTKTNGITAFYIINLKQPTSSGSKKYKATDTKDTAEKISGTGKKGSTRTITPVEGKKVASVVVTDKDGNKIDVTFNEDGTYSFKQPASDVTIEVNYKNREITLNIGSTEASVDGEKSNLDVCPITRNDRTMLPIRFVAENLGAKVGWNEKNPNVVTISRGETEIVIHLGSEKMLVNGKEVKLDSVAFAENDRTYLPVRAISEALNAIVEWNEEKPMEVKIYERQ